MKKYNIKKLKSEFGSTRLVTILVPDTFLRKVLVISTQIAFKSNKGDTGIGQIRTLNSLSVDLNTINFKVIKKHTSIKEAINFHIKKVNESKFMDCINLDV